MKTLSKVASKDIGEYIHISDFAFKYIAIDTMLYMYKYKTVMGKDWIVGFVNMIRVLKKNNVHLLFILDGKAPVQKIEEQNNRLDSREQNKDKIKIMEHAVKEYLNTGIIKDEIAIFKLDDQSTKVDVEAIRSEIEKKKKQVMYVTSEDINMLLMLLDSMNIKYIKALSEAEKLCSKLCKDNVVDAVLSDDTDVVAYGTPISLKKLDNKTGVCYKMEINTLLDNISLKYTEFLDFCIMCGTDYNKNIPGIGSMTSYKLIKEHKNIENINIKGKDILNVDTVRKLFIDFSDCNSNITLQYPNKPKYEDVYNFLKENSNYNISKKDFNLMFDSNIIIL
jgi:5'-3' exonuclease